VQGVYLTIQADGNGVNKLTKIRFARQRFSHLTADSWWHENKHWLAQKFNLRGSGEGGFDRSVRTPLRQQNSSFVATQPRESGGQALKGDAEAKPSARWVASTFLNKLGIVIRFGTSICDVRFIDGSAGDGQEGRSSLL